MASAPIGSYGSETFRPLISSVMHKEREVSLPCSYRFFCFDRKLLFCVTFYELYKIFLLYFANYFVFRQDSTFSLNSLIAKER